jgi:8-oxo-dGTP pyrophosphatase MutT (NUDIX family)
MIIFDPQSAEIEGIAGEAAVDPARLNLDWIRNRFITPPVWQSEFTDEHRLSPTVQFKNASVLIALVQREHGLNLLFTRRTAHLSQHAGQISFPGGRAELHDEDAIQTALRESQEEIGLDKSYVEILGRLPDYHTVTGYRVTLVVGAVADIPLLHSDPNEVDEVFEVPLAFLMDGGAHQRRSIAINAAEGQIVKRFFYAMPYQDYFIWGATAGMLRNLFHFLRA